MTYDLIVIGGGPAGFQGAESAAKAGLKVLLLEGAKLGGTCLNVGCIPTKAFLHSARLFEHARDAEKCGVFLSDPGTGHEDVLLRKDRIVRSMVQGVREALVKSGVDIVFERAVIKDRVPSGFRVLGGTDVYTGRNLLLCMGSTPCVPPVAGLQDALTSKRALTSPDIFGQTDIPGSLAVLGGGLAGLELGQYYSLSGSQVVVLEQQSHIAPGLDHELAEWLQSTLEEKGMTFRLGADVMSVSEGTLTFRKMGCRQDIGFDKLLVCTGRTPSLKGTGLSAIGLDENASSLETDAFMRTSVPGVYAAGDINGKCMLAHTAYREAETAVMCMLGKPVAMSYDAIPHVIYTQPEAAWVGESEASLTEQGIPCQVVKLPLSHEGRYPDPQASGGFVKALFASNGTLLGVHAVGGGSSEFIFGAAMAMESGLDASTAPLKPYAGDLLKACFAAFQPDLGL